MFNKRSSRLNPPALIRVAMGGIPPMLRAVVVIIIYVLFIIYLRSFLFDVNTWLYSVIILSLFCGLLWIIFLEVGCYREEQHGMTEIQANIADILEKPENGGLRKQPTVEDIEWVLDAEWNNAKGTVVHPPTRPWLVAVRIHEILSSVKAKMPFQLGQISSVNSYIARTEGLVTIFGGVSISLGVLGTYLGLREVYASIEDFTQLLNGVYEAIGSSIVGLSAAIVAQVIHGDLISQQRKFTQALDNFSTLFLLPRFQPEEISVKVDINEPSALIIGECIGKWLGHYLNGPIVALKATVELLHSIVDSFQKAVKKYDDSRNELVKETKEAIERWIKIITEAQTFIAETQKQFEILTQELISAGEVVKNSSGSLNTTVTTLEQTVSDMKDTFTVWVNLISALDERVQDMEVTSNKVLSVVSHLDRSLEGLADNYVRIVTETKNAIEVLQYNGNQTSQALIDAINEFKNTSETLKELTKRVEDTIPKPQWRLGGSPKKEKQEDNKK
jgi:hypothetical protein